MVIDEKDQSLPEMVPQEEDWKIWISDLRCREKETVIFPY